MPFNATLSAGQITQVRKTSQAFEHYLLVNPNNIVWQADVDDTKTSENYAEFEWANTLQGDRSNVMVGMVVLITTSTTDFSNPVIRGRVRSAPGATTFYINETGTDIDTSMYLTVIDDFDIMERLQRVGVTGAKYKDWDETWADLPPVIDGLQSVYVDFSGSDPVTYSFAPTATAAASGAAISSWLWDVGDGSITVGTAASQNITVEFPGYGTNEHRWVHLTVTDDNSNATVFHFEVYTVHKQSSTAVKLDAGDLQINGTIEDGWNAIITGWDGLAISEVLDQTRVAIAGIDNYDGTATPIVSNIMMIGRLRKETSRTVADDQASAIADTVFTIEGFAAQLARLPAPALSIEDTASPASWGEITNPTPYRAIVYFLAYHTTYGTLSSISSDDLSGYVLGDFSLGETTALDNLNKQMDSVNGIAAFAPSGETTLRRKASYQSTAARAGLTTVFNFTTADLTPDLVMDFEYGETVGEIEAGAVVYNTTSDDIDYRYIGRAPASGFGSGHETAQLNGQVLTANSSDNTARAELVQRAGDHLAYINPKKKLTAGVMDGFWFLIPTLHQRYTFTLAATDTQRGRVYTTADFWQLVSINYAADNELNTREVSATFEEETQGENAGISVALVPDVNALDYSLPPLGAYDTFPDDGLTNFPVDDPDSDPYFGGGMAAALEPAPGNQDSPANCETLNIPMYGEFSRGTTRDTVFGETYTITVEGEATVESSTETLRDSFSVDATDSGFTDGTYVMAAGTTYRTRVSDFVQYGAGRYADAQWANPDDDWTYPGTLIGPEANINFQSGGLLASDDTDFNPSHVYEYTRAGANAVESLKFQDTAYGDNALSFSIDVFEVGAGDEHGDAFYTNYSGGGSAELYPDGQGLLINASRPGTIGPYQSGHAYTFTVTGTGAPLSFKFKLADYSGVSHNVLRIQVCGPNMGVTT